MFFLALFTVVSSRLGEGWVEMRVAFLPKGCFFCRGWSYMARLFAMRAWAPTVFFSAALGRFALRA